VAVPAIFFFGFTVNVDLNILAGKTLQRFRLNGTLLFLQQREAPDAFMAITVWNTEGDAEAYDKSGQALEMVNKIRFAFAGPPTLCTYDAFGIR